jgi:Domain of unknown function (DUF4136)
MKETSDNLGTRTVIDPSGAQVFDARRIIIRKGSIKMKTAKIFSVLFFIGFTISCSSIYDVKSDYDRQTNFSTLKTFDWMQAPQRTRVNSLIVQRVKNAVNAELEAKGLTMTSNNPDFLIAEYHGKKDQIQISDWGYGRAHRYGYSPAGVSVYEFEEGSLILDFVDTESKKLIWRGSAKAQIDSVDTPEKSEKLINAAVNKILEKYPPSSAK